MKKYEVFWPIILMSIACTQNDRSIETYQSEKQVWTESSSMSGSSNVQTTKKKSSEFKWIAPQGWIKSEGSSMRIGSFDLLGKSKSEKADLSIVTLGGSAGGYIANINRWRAQVGLKSLEEMQINSQVKVIQSHIGKIKYLLINNTTNNEGILSGVFEGKDKVLFIKAKGPSSVLSFQEKNFKKFLASFDVN